MRRAKAEQALEPSGAVIVLSGATPLRRQKAAEVRRRTATHLASVDLAAVVSQHVRETEKNVNRVFDMANRRGSILFFDRRRTPCSANGRRVLGYAGSICQ